jgi:hypothetical protein
MATASATFIEPDSPRIDKTAVTQAPSDSAPFASGLRWHVKRPSPARLKVFAVRTLQRLQDQHRLAWPPSSSCPLMWAISTLRVEPQNAQMGRPGGLHSGA